MRGPLLVLLALFALAAPAAAQERRASLPDIEDEVMCVQCGTPLNISAAPSADRMRAYIRRRIDEGMTKAQIKDALLAEYGRGVLATPSRGGFDVAAWLVPVLLALAALGVIWTTVRRWKRTGDLREAQTDDETRNLPEDQAKRLERDMAGYDL